jgi:hypothetical protein
MEYKDIVAAAAKLSDSGKLAGPIKTVAVKAEVVKANFIAACASIPMDDLLALGDDVATAFTVLVGTDKLFENFGALDVSIQTLYNTLPDRFFSDTPASDIAAPETAPTTAATTATETVQSEAQTSPAAETVPQAPDIPAAPETAAMPPVEQPVPMGDGSLGVDAAPTAEQGTSPSNPRAPKTPTAPKEPKKPGEKGYKSECRDYGKKPDDNNALCQSCKTAKADEYAACHAIVATKAEKANKPKSEKKPPVFTKNQLGHRVGGQGDFIDNMLLIGPKTETALIEGVLANFKTDSKKAQGKLVAHLRYLVQNDGHIVKKDVVGEGESKVVTYTLVLNPNHAPAVPTAPAAPTPAPAVPAA